MWVRVFTDGHYEGVGPGVFSEEEDPFASPDPSWMFRRYLRPKSLAEWAHREYLFLLFSLLIASCSC